ncbi:alpha/beta hydrolase [Streptomyces sp. NBC_01498]|uniref:alpha/beta hydrolase n=1 Tax=Streptomyces sp. NBC_01498 TaxID=2975870 RepID=UPI002E7B95CB|nr:alpha/beta hydrolase [Streptomyces sp. NBC_01498]WTL28387.1 alpha/beta hydrolase [Streptomyces sp. NBC_01498]
MTTYRNHSRKTLLLALSAALAGSLTVAGPAGGAGAVEGGGGGAPAWTPCARAGGPAEQECAELEVPVDYREPGGRQLTIAVSRVRAEDPAARRGTLLMIPGGPGGSGVQALARRGNALREELDGAYDLVSFDPRGVGGSTTASCGLDADDRYLANLRSWPDADGGIAENVARSRRTAEACHANGGAVLRSFTSANEVRDIERFRQALGEEKLSALGNSYGTYVGAVYAQKYPTRTDRWVLDSSGDPDPTRVEQGWMANTSRAVEDRFPDFAAWAADPDRDDEGLRLAERARDVRELFIGIAAELDRTPKESTTEGNPLTGNMLRQAFLNGLYGDSAFPQLARLVQAAHDPAATPVLTPEIAQPLRDEDAAVTMGVVCNDVRWPTSVGAYARATKEDRARHPLTAGMPRNVGPCAFWKGEYADRPTRVTDRGPSNILMIQSLRDPSTPYFGGLRMREALGDRARLVTVDQGGHGMYLANGNACGDSVVTTFLRTGERPRRDVYCAN